MRFFKDTKRIIQLDNDPDADLVELKKLHIDALKSDRDYHAYLETIAPRLSKQAYFFFRFGFGDTGLHDGFILSLTMGDAVGAPGPAYPTLSFARSKSIVELKILTYKRDVLHTFTFRTLRKVVIDIPSETPLFFDEGKTLGQISNYEIIATSPRYLQIEWLLDTGGTIIIEFEKLTYKRAKVRTERTPKKKVPSPA